MIYPISGPAEDAGESLDGWLSFIEQHFAAEFLEFARSYAATLLNRNLPVVFDLTHLAGRIGVPTQMLRTLVAEPRYFYRTFSIPKKRGGRRQIDAPYPAATVVQMWISKFILSRLEVSGHAHGFVRFRSTVTNAREHLSARCMLRIDIEDFFPSIGLSQVIAIFKSLGYSQEACYALARACTLDNKLPQGASTSPHLANLVARRLDARLAGLAHSLALVYTRYADDLIFSGNSISLAVPKFVTAILESEGFRANSSKTLLARGAQRKIITGVSVTSNVTRIPRELRRKLRAQVYRALRDPVGSSFASSGVHESFDPQHLQRLLASIAYWKHIEPTSDFAVTAHARLKTLIAELKANVGSGSFGKLTTGTT